MTEFEESGELKGEGGGENYVIILRNGKINLKRNILLRRKSKLNETRTNLNMLKVDVTMVN